MERKRGLIMKRKIYSICFVFALSILLLAGCQKEEKKDV